MARKTESFKIGENTYEVTQMGIKQAQKTWKKISGYVYNATDAIRGDDDDARLGLVKMLTRVVDIETLAGLALSYGQFTRVTSEDGKTISLGTEGAIDDMFAGNYGELVDYVVEATLVNFKSFVNVKSESIQHLGTLIFSGSQPE